jgi:hypothetical protein
MPHVSGESKPRKAANAVPAPINGPRTQELFVCVFRRAERSRKLRIRVEFGRNGRVVTEVSLERFYPVAIGWMVLAPGVRQRFDQAPPSKRHHDDCCARRDEVDADDQPQCPNGSTWPSLNDQPGQDQVWVSSGHSRGTRLRNVAQCRWTKTAS